MGVSRTPNHKQSTSLLANTSTKHISQSAERICYKFNGLLVVKATHSITCVILWLHILTICSYTTVRGYESGMSQASLDKMVVRHAKYGLFTPRNDRERAFVKAAQRRLAAGTEGCTSVNTPGQIITALPQILLLNNLREFPVKWLVFFLMLLYTAFSFSQKVLNIFYHHIHRLVSHVLRITMCQVLQLETPCSRPWLPLAMLTISWMSIIPLWFQILLHFVLQVSQSLR